MPSQPETDPEGPYLTENFDVPNTFPEQSISSLENNMVIEQSCTTKKTLLDHIIEEELYRKDQEPWDIPIPPPFSYMAPFPSSLKSPNPFSGDGQSDEMMNLVETSQEPQVNNILEEALPTILYQDSLNPYLAHYEVDDFDDDGYNIEDIDQVDSSYLKTIPLLIENFDPPPIPSHLNFW